MEVRAATAKSTGMSDLGEDAKAVGWTDSSSEDTAPSAQQSMAGVECVSSARLDLCGGRPKPKGEGRRYRDHSDSTWRKGYGGPLCLDRSWRVLPNC